MSDSNRTRQDPNALIERHLYLVQHVVNQLGARYPRHVDRQDMWSAGATGLVDAAQRYDPDAGVPFERWAAIRIRGAIIDASRERDWATRRVRTNMRDVNDAEATLAQRHGRAPSDTELAESLGVTESDVRARRAAADHARLLALDARVVPADDTATFADLVEDDDEDLLPHEALERTEMRGAVHTAIARLPATQREIVERSFFHDHLLRDIAADLHVTEARVSQVRTEALHAIQAYLADTYEHLPAPPASAPGARRRATFASDVAAATTWRHRLTRGGHAASTASW